MNTNRHIAILVNPLSGKGQHKTIIPLLKKKLAVETINYTLFDQELPNNLSGFTDLIILGGDGTVNYVINHFKEILCPISIIPCGTGNDVAFHLLGEQTIESYCQTAINGHPTPIDAGICNGQLFLNGVGIGFDGWVVKKLMVKKWLTGKAAYYSTVISLLLFYKEQFVALTMDGKTFRCNLFMLSVANGSSYGGGFKVAPFAQMNDGELETILVTKIGLLERIKNLPVIENGKHLNKPYPFIQYQQNRHLQLNSPKKLTAHLDGELMEASNFDIRILCNQFKIRI